MQLSVVSPGDKSERCCSSGADVARGVQLKAGREVLKITRSPGDAAAAVQPATDLAIGTVAVKTAQFLEGLYFQVSLLPPTHTRRPAGSHAPLPDMHCALLQLVYAVAHAACAVTRARPHLCRTETPQPPSRPRVPRGATNAAVRC